MNAIIALILSALTFATAMAVPRECTQIGCESGVFIDLQKPDRWAPGTYVFHFILDGRDVKCEAELPLPACGTNAIRCDHDGVSIMEVGCALPRSAQGFGRIKIEGFPAKLAAEVIRNEKRIGLLRSRPTYSDARPNGPGCEPLCRQAREKIELK